MKSKAEKNEYQKKWNAAHKDILKERRRQYYLTHRDEALAAQKKWHYANRDAIRQSGKRHRAQHKVEIADAKKLYYAEHREQILARHRRYYIAHQEHIKNKVAVYRETHQEQINIWFAEYQTANPDYWREGRHRRRQRQAGGSCGRMANGSWQGRVAEFNGYCAYCLKPMHKVTMDHMRPLCKGGKHEIGNLVPCCKSCNSKKGTKTLLEFIWGREFVPKMAGYKA